MERHLVRPDLLRQIPRNFSWLDHRLVREGHLKDLTTDSAAFYLFLVIVSDYRGISFYSEKAILQKISIADVSACRDELIIAGLLAFDQGVYQVLEVPALVAIKKVSCAVAREKEEKSTNAVAVDPSFARKYLEGLK